MALKKKPVTGMKDMLPKEMEIRDYVIQMIKDTYKTFGFTSIETPCVEHIENLCSKQGGDNEKLIFKILKRTFSPGKQEGTKKVTPSCLIIPSPFEPSPSTNAQILSFFFILHPISSRRYFFKNLATKPLTTPRHL